MKIISKVSVFFFFAVALAVVQFGGTEARAQSSYFATNCGGCHSAPAVSTCNGCHAHGTHSSSAKNTINVTGTTDKTTYAPGETVSVTIAGGYRTGWVRAVLFNQNGVEVARSVGNGSGMGGSTTLPAVLTAPAPTGAGTYTWKAAWYGNMYDASGATFGAGWTPDVNNPNHGYEMVSTNSFTVGSAADTTIPVVSVFTLPATATSLTVPVTTFTATDNVAVTGYQITTSATAPTTWLTAAPTSVIAPAAGSTTFYAWARDAAGNVSLAKSATVTITLPDTTIPVVSVFTLPATATSLTVPVTTFTATDNVGVTGYQITTSATAPTTWLTAAPTSVIAPAAGSTTFYAWARDAAGNVSLAKSATVTVTLPDTTIPVVSVFTLPATASSLTVPVSAFTATDNVAVTGYQITTSAAAPTTWLTAAPTSVTAPAAGSTTFYAWVVDAAGNVSLAKSATVTVTLPDTTIPVVSVFTLPVTASSLTVPVSAFTATDNVAVTGYQITTSAAAPTTWLTAAPTSVTAPAAGSTTFYAWARDAAGNVSLAKSATVAITLPDTTLPVVSVFTLPVTASSLIVPVSAFTATDNVGVTGYQITTSSTAPTTWLTAAPTSVTAPAAGSTTFYAWVRDAAGNVSLAKSATVAITLPDATLPVVSVFTLPATATSLTVPVSVFTATDNVGVTGYQITTSATAPTSWLTAAPTSVTAPAAGSTTFYAWVRDAAGNVSLAKSATVTVTISSTGPALTISTLADGTYTNNATLNVSGNASDSVGIKSVTVNGQAVTVNPDGSFTIALTLKSGANTITVIAIDTAGIQTSVTRTITYDPNAPVLTVTAPADNSRTTQSFITVSGSINETSTVTVQVNNSSPQAAAISGNSFSATVNLVAGVNTITINATDLAGNISSAKRTVTYDNTNTALTLAVTYPNQDISTDHSTLVLKGTVKDALSKVTVKVTMDGKTYTPVINNGVFYQRLSFTTAKQYVITVIATDAAGNSSTVIRNVIYKSDDSGADDVNGDHTVTLADAALAAQIAAGTVNPTAAQLASADVVQDGTINNDDVYAILKKALGN